MTKSYSQTQTQPSLGGEIDSIITRMKNLIDIFSEVTKTDGGEIGGDIQRYLMKKSEVEVKFMEAFQKGFEKYKINEKDADAVKETIGAFIKDITMHFIKLKSFYPHDWDHTRNKKDFLKCSLQSFMLGFIPAFYPFDQSSKNLLEVEESIKGSSFVELYLQFIILKCSPNKVKYTLELFESKGLISNDEKDAFQKQLDLSRKRKEREFLTLSQENKILMLLREKSESLFNSLNLSIKIKTKIESLFHRTISKRYN